MSAGGNGRVRTIGIALVAFVVQGGGSPARGQPEGGKPPAPRPAVEKPWAKGVSPARRARALQLFRKGNKLFEQSQYKAALTQYRAAVQAWDHPAIRYNMAVCQIHLDHPLEAFSELQGALRYGAAGLKPKIHHQAVTYRKLLKGRLAFLRVVCRQSGARVTLDGKVLFTSPGEQRRVLLPGKHALVVSKAGYLTDTRTPFLVPGRETVVRIKLLPVSAAIQMRRRWKKWWPWTILAAGAALAASGVPLLLQARSHFRDYDDQVKALCPTGCEDPDLPRAVSDLESRARQENRAALALFGVGGAVLAAGITLVILNMPRAVKVSTPTGEHRRRVTVLPSVTPGGGGLQVRLRF